MFYIVPSRFEPLTFQMKSCGATNSITMWLCMIRKWAVIRFSIHASTKPSLMIHQGCQHASWICGQSATVLDSAIVAPLLKTIPPPRNLSSVYLQSPKFSVFYVQKPDLYVKSTNEVKKKNRIRICSASTKKRFE